MRHNRFCLEPKFKWCDITNLTVDCSIHEVNRSVNSFGPKLEWQSVEMEHAPSGFADCAIVPFDVAVLLGCVWRVGFARDSFLFKQ